VFKNREMKNIILTITVILLINCSRNEEPIATRTKLFSNKEMVTKPFQVKSGVIKYQITLQGKVFDNKITGTGTETLYFKNWGKMTLNQSIVNKIISNGINETHQQIKKTQKTEGNIKYTVHYKTKTITKEKISFNTTDSSILEQNGAVNMGCEVIQGYNCTLWKIENTKQWIYKGIPLKTVIKIMGVTTVKEAVLANFNLYISDDVFSLPSYPIKE